MAETHVITALVRKYRQLSGRLIACEKDAASLRADLAHLDAAIRMFKEDYDVAGIPPKRPYRPGRLFRCGTISRNALDILRAAGPLSSREIILAALKGQGVTEADEATIRGLRNSLNGALRRREKAGLVVSSRLGGEIRWAVSPR